jgi:hypothetical protein
MFSNFHAKHHGWVVTFLLCSQEVPDSNLGTETSYPDWGFVVFLGPFRQMLGHYLNIRPWLLRFIYFPTRHSLIIHLYSTLYDLSHWKVLLNKVQNNQPHFKNDCWSTWLLVQWKLGVNAAKAWSMSSISMAFLLDSTHFVSEVWQRTENEAFHCCSFELWHHVDI